jgi:hypothetical protein
VPLGGGSFGDGAFYGATTNGDHYKGSQGHRATTARFRGGMATSGIKNIAHEDIISGNSNPLTQPIAQFDLHTKRLHEQSLLHGSLYVPTDNFWGRPVEEDVVGRQGELKNSVKPFLGEAVKISRKKPWQHGMTAHNESRQAVMAMNAIEGVPEYEPPKRPPVPERHEISFKQYSNRPAPCLRPFPEMGQRPMSGTGWFPASQSQAWPRGR